MNLIKMEIDMQPIKTYSPYVLFNSLSVMCRTEVIYADVYFTLAF